MNVMLSSVPAMRGTGMVPGLRIDVRERPRAAPVRPDSAVPAFLGIGAERNAPLNARQNARQGVECLRLADFDRLVEPVGGGHLRAAVRGFFANGGERCVVLLADRFHGLRRLLEPGAPLCDRDDIDLICMPDAASAKLVGKDGARGLQALQIEHCERMGDRFAILDAPDGFEGFRSGEAATGMTVPQLPFDLRSPFGAMYFPWVVADPARRDEASDTIPAAQWRRKRPASPSAPGHEAVPPCGHVAGLFARTDRQIGAHRAPANQLLEDALDLSHAVSISEQAMLSDARINCLVRVPARGIQVGGARTLSGHDRWAYVSTARVVIGFRRWLGHGMADIAFEPNTPALQERIRLRLLEHCLALWKTGALVGDTASQAFGVKCDRELNTEAVRERGQVVAEISLAPSVPAEFIEVRVVYDANGIAINGT